MKTIEYVAKTIPCGLCGAGAGQRCRTPSGTPSTASHQSRTALLEKLWREAYAKGYTAGESAAERRAVKASMAHHPSNGVRP